MNPHNSIIKALQVESKSLAELQQITQVSLPTLRKAVQELTEGGWIRIVGQAEANGGRPPKIYGLDERHFAIIGVHLQLPGIRLITADLTGAVINEYQIDDNIIPTPNDAVQTIIDYVSRIRATLPTRMILGVSIAAPGFTDPESGDILSIGRVDGWHNYPICNHLNRLLGLPTWIANDVDCMAFAEFNHSGITFDSNLIYVGFDEGVKASMFLNGELYKGAFGNAGLIASNLINVSIPHSQDDISQILSIHGCNAVFDRHIEKLSTKDQLDYADIVRIKDARTRFEQIMESLPQGLLVTEQVVGLLIETLASVIANLTFIIQPEVLVIGGVMGSAPQFIFDKIETNVRQNLPSLISNHVVIQRGKLSSPNCSAIGGVYYFLDHYLSDHTFELVKYSRADS